MKKYLFIIFALFTFIPIAYADTNYNTDFNVTLSEESTLSTNKIDNQYTFLDILDLVYNTSKSSSYYDLISIFSTNNNGVVGINFYIIPKNTLSNLEFYSHSSNGNPNLFTLIRINNSVTGNFRYKDFYFYNNGSSILTNSDFVRLNNCLNNGCDNSLVNFSNSNFSSVYGVSSSSNNSSLFINFSDHYNNNSYTNKIVYYSSLPLIYTHNEGLSSDYYKSLVFNGKRYNVGEEFPTYKDIYFPEDNYNILLDKDNITNMLVGNITDLYNFRLNLRFFYDNYDYINNMTANYRIYGRKNNTTYYSYEDITSSCSAINSHELDKDIDTNSKYAQFHYFSQGISCNPNLDLTQYDNFYLDIQTFATSGNYFISYLEYSSTNGNVYFPNSSAYSIYDTFTNLSSDFSLLVTTNYSQRQVNVISNNKYVIGCLSNLYKLSTNGACPSPATIGNSSNYGYMIYKYPEDTSNTVDLSILTSFDSIISYGSNGTGDNSSYTYYDESGTITTGVINNTITLNYNTDNYDVSDYFGVVNDYIDSLSSDINNFSSLVQNFYNSSPQFIQLFFYIVFIIICTYFVYLMIRK